MSGLRLGRALWGIGLAGLAAGAVAIALTLSSDHVDEPGRSAVLVAFVGWSFVGTGLFAWWRRSGQRSGALMVAVGFAWFAASLIASDSPPVFTLGAALGSVYIVICAQMLLAFTRGGCRAPASAGSSPGPISWPSAARCRC